MPNVSSRALTALTSSAASVGLLLLGRKNSATAFATPPSIGVTKFDSKPSLSRPSTVLLGGKGNNPFESLLGNMASYISPSLGGNIDTSEVNIELKNVDGMSTWEDVKSNLNSKQTENEKNFRDDVKKGIVASPLNKIRLFDENMNEEDIRVTFYRDHASWCPYCHKVWMALEEKKIPYRVEKINMRCYGEKPPSFARLQPSGAIPVAIIDGTVYNQSNDIIYVLEELFPDSKRLLPPPSDNEKRIKAQSLLRLERTLFSAWMYWLTGGFDPEGNRASFVKVLNDVERELMNAPGGDFFLGDSVSLVDFMFAPFLERMAASLTFFKGFEIRVAKEGGTEYPAINRWFDAMEGLESYQLTKSDYYTHCWDLPPQLGGCTYEKAGKRYELAINGEKSLGGKGGSWELPLVPHNGGAEPDWEWCGDDSVASREAVERLSFNSKNIVAFAARGAGRKGMPSYSAALSDPNAVPNDVVKEAVDSCLRIVSIAMLDGTDKQEMSMREVAGIVVKSGGSDFVDGVVASLAYLRDRVGVPRDMRLPAARKLRAHLNWSIGIILSAQDAS